jgi:hypothetical protein
LTRRCRPALKIAPIQSLALGRFPACARDGIDGPPHGWPRPCRSTSRLYLCVSKVGGQNLGGPDISAPGEHLWPSWGARRFRPDPHDPQEKKSSGRGRIGRHLLHGHVAEREGFEPSRRFPAYTLSRRAPSTTRPPLQRAPEIIFPPLAQAPSPPREPRTSIRRPADHPGWPGPGSAERRSAGPAGSRPADA